MNRMHVDKPILKWIDIPSTDPDDTRRRKLLSILLAGPAALSILAILWSRAILARRTAVLAGQNAEQAIKPSDLAYGSVVH